MIPCWVYWSSFCFWWSIPLGIRYNYLYWVGYSLMWFPIWYLCIISGIFMPVIYPWCPRVIGWVSTQPCFFYPSDVFQGLSSWGRLPLSLINHLLCLTLRVQLLYSFVRNWLVQFQCAAIISCCFFLFHRPVVGGVLNLALSMVRTFQLCSNKSLDTLVCIHHLLQNNTVSLLIRISVDIILGKPLCFLAYAFLMLSLFPVRFRFLLSVRMSSCWLVKQLLNCFVHYLLKFPYEFQLVSLSVDFWWTFFIFSVFLITCVILRWLFCRLLLPCFSSMVAWLSCHFMSLWWQASQGLFPCVWWNFFHSL